MEGRATLRKQWNDLPQFNRTMTELTTAYIGLGSNLGDRKGFIDKALKLLAEAEGVEVGRVSDVIETAGLGEGSGPDYLNAVAEVKTALGAEDLHKRMAEIEEALGRMREGKWSARTIDLDLLLFGDKVIESRRLTVPHRQMHLRSFVLKGLCQLNSGLLHPVIRESVGELMTRLNGADYMPSPGRPQLVSIAGIIGVGKTTLAKKLSNLLSCKVVFEAYDTNPFLPQVYAGRKELALDSQLYFLTSRGEQLNRESLAGGEVVISDYVFEKELIYARRLLNERQLGLYERIYPVVSAEVVRPVLVIYLTDSAEVCLERIGERNRPYEQDIRLEFLERLGADYERLFAEWKESPVIRKQTSQLGDVEQLADQAGSYLAIN